MKNAWDGICNAYLSAFCKKHLMDMNEAYWGHDDPGTIACIEGVFVEMDVIRYDIDNDVAPEMFWRWYNYDLDICELEEDYRYYKDEKVFNHISYASFCKGAPLPYSLQEISDMRREIAAMKRPVDHGLEYIRIMSGIVGTDITVRSRKAQVTWPRYLVMYQLRKDGLFFREIAGIFGVNHTTVVHGVKEVHAMLDMPRMYPDEIRLWQRFQKIIKDEQVF